MSLPDATAAAAMDGDVVKPVWFVFLDILGEPVRANSSGADITISGSGQENLDGEYIGVDPRFISMSPIKVTPGGSDTRWMRLSGIRGLDDEDRALLADPANWQERLVQRWRLIRNADNVQQGGIQHIDTGYMMSLTHLGSASEMMLELTYESYLAAFGQAAHRTYLDQERFDELDLSGRAALAIANGNTSSPLTGGAGGAGTGRPPSWKDPSRGWRV